LEYTTLGWSDVKISKIGLGLWQVSETWGLTNYSEVKAIISKALEIGINLFDTAMVYGNGLSEEYLGRALKDTGVKREDVIIATKIPGEYLDPMDIFRTVNASLKRMGVEYIDLLQIHWPPCWHNFPTCKYGRALEKLVLLGKVNYIGVSNYPLILIEELRSCFSTIDIVSMQYRFNIVEREAEEELIPYAEANDFTFLPWSPLARGALTGKYSLENLSSIKDFRARDPIFSPTNFTKIQKVIDILRELSVKYGKTPTQIALNWLLTYSPVIVPIPGAKKPEQVVENAGSIDFKLSYEDWFKLSEVGREIRLSYATNYLE